MASGGSPVFTRTDFNGTRMILSGSPTTDECHVYPLVVQQLKATYPQLTSDPVLLQTLANEQAQLMVQHLHRHMGLTQDDSNTQRWIHAAPRPNLDLDTLHVPLCQLTVTEKEGNQTINRGQMVQISQSVHQTKVEPSPQSQHMTCMETQEMRAAPKTWDTSKINTQTYSGHHTDVVRTGLSPDQNSVLETSPNRWWGQCINSGPSRESSQAMFRTQSSEESIIKSNNMCDQKVAHNRKSRQTEKEDFSIHTNHKKNVCRRKAEFQVDGGMAWSVKPPEKSDTRNRPTTTAVMEDWDKECDPARPLITGNFKPLTYFTLGKDVSVSGKPRTEPSTAATQRVEVSKPLEKRTVRSNMSSAETTTNSAVKSHPAGVPSGCSELRQSVKVQDQEEKNQDKAKQQLKWQKVGKKRKAAVKTGKDTKGC